MSSLSLLTNEYSDYCRSQKCLDEKTLKAYKIDLRQFCNALSDLGASDNISDITADILENYISRLHNQYKPKTAYQRRNALRHRPTHHSTYVPPHLRSQSP